MTGKDIPTVDTPRIAPADIRGACEHDLAAATATVIKAYERLVDQLAALRATIPQLGTPREHDGEIRTASGYLTAMVAAIQTAQAGAGLTRVVTTAGQFDRLVTPPSPDRP